MADYNINVHISGKYPDGCLADAECIALDCAADLFIERFLNAGQNNITVSRRELLQIIWDTCHCFNDGGIVYDNPYEKEIRRILL